MRRSYARFGTASVTVGRNVESASRHRPPSCTSLGRLLGCSTVARYTIIRYIRATVRDRNGALYCCKRKAATAERRTRRDSGTQHVSCRNPRGTDTLRMQSALRSLPDPMILGHHTLNLLGRRGWNLSRPSRSIAVQAGLTSGPPVQAACGAVCPTGYLRTETAINVPATS